MSPCGPGRHDFDPVSGWCAHCTTRDDGRLVDARPDRRSGRVLQPGSRDRQHEEESTR